MGQQEETLAYFRQSTAEWRQRAEGTVPQRVNVIAQRNEYVVQVAQERGVVRHALDVGCGTGELVCDLARMGINTLGVDFAPEMIELSRKKKRDEGVKGAEFVCISIFDYDPGDARFDFISANGFIEYISPEELRRFLDFVKPHLSPGASLVVGSRNRLFNVFTLNEYTKLERELGVFHQLVDESLVIASAPDMSECLKALQAFTPSLLTVAEHPKTAGIGVTTRHQYTPSQLIGLLQEYGLKTVDLYPVHYHGALPRFMREHPDAHIAMAELMQQFAKGRAYLIPSSTTFMLHAILEG